MAEDVSEKKSEQPVDAQTASAAIDACNCFRSEILDDRKTSSGTGAESSTISLNDMQKQGTSASVEQMKDALEKGAPTSGGKDRFPHIQLEDKEQQSKEPVMQSGEKGGTLGDILKPGPKNPKDLPTDCGFNIPDLKLEDQQKPELPEKLGEAADNLAKLLKANASPEELQKAFEDFQKNAEGVDGKAAAERLQQAIYNERMGAKYSADFKDGKFSVTDIGEYQTLGRFEYNGQVRFADPTATRNPDAIKLADEFADTLMKGVSQEDLQKLLPELLRKFEKMGLADLQAGVLIDQALNRHPDLKRDQDGNPIYKVGGQEGMLWTSHPGGEFLINFKPRSKQVL